MLTIAGGTGLVGSKLTKILIENNSRVRVLTRDRAKAQLLFGTSAIEIVEIDFDDPASLAKGFAGSKRAFLSTGTSPRQVKDEIALIDAAVEAGVPHLVNLSVGGAGGTNLNNVLSWHTQIDAHVATKGVASTLIRPTTYADSILHLASAFIPSDQWGGTAGDGKASFIDTRDVAAVAAAVLTGGAEHEGQVYELSGPEAVSMKELADLIADRTRSSVVYHERSPIEQRAALTAAGLPELMVEVVLGLDDLTRSGIFETPWSTVLDLTGKPARPITKLIGENAATLQPKVAA